MSYDFSIIGVLKEGFYRSNGVKLIFVGAIIIFIAISIFVAGLLDFIFPQGDSNLNIYAVSFLKMIFTLPILVGVMMLGVKRARDKDLDIPSIFNYYTIAMPIIFAYIIVTLITTIGFLLLILPGIYLSVSYSFTYMLIVDKGLGIWEAMELSRKTITLRWFKFFVLALLCGVIIILSAIPLGVGLIWTLPMIYITYGLLYHRLFDDYENKRCQ